MDALSNLLKRLHESLNKDEILKNKVLMVIQTETKIDLDPKKISLKNGVLEIDSSPVINTEIRFKEEKIKTTLKTEGVVIGRFLYK